MYPYPKVSDVSEAVSAVLAVKSDLKNNVPTLVHAEWVAQGFVSSLAAPSGLTAEAPIESEAEALEVLESSSQPFAAASADESEAGKIPWAKIAAAVKFLLALFGG